MSVPKAFMCVLVSSGLWVVTGSVIIVPDVFVPIRVCHKAIHLYGVEQDDQMTTGIMNSLVFLDQPFEFHTQRYYQQKRFDDLSSAVRFACLAHIVVVRGNPLVRQINMNFVLKRFNRARGNENDFVLVFAPKKDGISKSTDWRASLLNHVLPRNLPDNALLIELDERAESESGLSHFYVSDVYIFQLYCDEEQEVCWKRQSVALLPKHKNDFDASFSRERAQWRYNYNRWPMQLEIVPESKIDYVATMTFREAILGRFTRDDYNLAVQTRDWHAFHASTIWLLFGIAEHMNATLQPKPPGFTLEEITEIKPWTQMRAHAVLEQRPYSRNIYIDFKYYMFGYCTNGTGGRENTSLFSFFVPFDVISWIVLSFMMVAIAVLGWYAGHGFQLFQLIACLGSQSFSVNSKDRLAALFVLWHLIAFVIFNCYCAFLESVLAVPYLESRIQDFEELSKSCEHPWIYSTAQADFKDRFCGIPHLKALIDRSQFYKGLIEPNLYRDLLEHEKNCIIFQTHRNSDFFTSAGAKFQPDATCSAGNEMMIGDPEVWHFVPPNAAIIYRTVRTLEAGGVLLKFGEYYGNRKTQLLDHFVTDSLRVEREKFNITEHADEEYSESEVKETELGLPYQPYDYLPDSSSARI